MSVDAAYELAKRALRLADEGRWRELVALVDEEALGDVASLDEPGSLDAAEVMVSGLEAREALNTARAEDPRLDGFAQELMEVQKERRQPIGIVEDGGLTAHVLYRLVFHVTPGELGLELLTLRLTDRGWRVLPHGEMFGRSGWTMSPYVVPGSADAGPGPRSTQMEQLSWLERTFPSGLHVGLLPALLSRFAGNLQRLHNLGYGVSNRGRTAPPPGGGWSIQEHIGHLLELERLGEIRLAEFERSADVLSGADMRNRATEEARYNEQSIDEIMSQLTEMRFDMIGRLERLTRTQLEHSALHPRLQQPMNVMDWLFFMCEHDDHHIARAERLKREYLHALMHPGAG